MNAALFLSPLPPLPISVENDFLNPKNDSHPLNDGYLENYPSIVALDSTGGDQQHSSFDSSTTTNSTVTTETTIVTAGGASSTADQLIDFASLSMADELSIQQSENARDAGASDANFNPLTPFGTTDSENVAVVTQQTTSLDLHNLSINNNNNNSINPFYTNDNEPCYDGSIREASANNVTEAVFFDLGAHDNASSNSTTTTTTTSTSSNFFNNNNNTPSNNAPWLVSATSDSQENRDLSLL